MSDFALNFIPEMPQAPKLGPDGVPEGYFVNPNTGQMTSRELLRNANKGRTRFDAVTSGAARGLTFGGADEVAGGLSALAAPFRGQDVGEAYNFGLENARARIEADREAYPGTQLLSEVAAALSLPVGYFANAGRGAGIARTAAEGAAIGGAQGGLYGFLDAEGGADQRLDQARRGAVTGAAIGGAAGAAIPAALRAADRGASKRATTALAKTVKSEDEMRDAAQKIYKYLEGRGVTLDDGSFGDFVKKVGVDAAMEGADDQLTPTTSRVLKRLADTAAEGNVTFQKLETLRKVANSLPQNPAEADRRLIGRITAQIDDYVANLVDGDITAGNIEGLSDDILRARKLWATMKKSQRISQAIEAAEDTASGFENGLRIEFRKLLRDKEFARRMTADEKKAIREVVQGTVLGNWLKRVSKIGFGRGQQTNVLGGTVAGIGGALGLGLSGPVGAAAGATIPGVMGKIGSVGSEAITRAAANRARAIAASGGTAPRAVSEIPAVANALRALERSAPLQNAVIQPR